MLRRTSSPSLVTSYPATVAGPPVGRASVHSILMVVDFPAPFGPRNPKVSPRATSNDTPATASISPYRLLRFSTVTASAASDPGGGAPASTAASDIPPTLRRYSATAAAG